MIADLILIFGALISTVLMVGSIVGACGAPLMSILDRENFESYFGAMLLCIGLAIVGWCGQHIFLFLLPT